MVEMVPHLITKGSSLTRLHALLGEDFLYSKEKAEMYFKSTHYHLWKIITYDDIKISSLGEE